MADLEIWEPQTKNIVIESRQALDEVRTWSNLWMHFLPGCKLKS